MGVGTFPGPFTPGSPDMGAQEPWFWGRGFLKPTHIPKGPGACHRCQGSQATLRVHVWLEGLRTQNGCHTQGQSYSSEGVH